MAVGIKPLIPETDQFWANEGIIENGAMMMGAGGLQNLREI